MKIEGEGKLLRIFIGEADRYEGKPLYHALVEKAREMGMAGATVIRGVMGFGAHSRLHSARLLRLSEDLPLIIEIVDTDEKVRRYVEEIDDMFQDGLITIEKAEVIRYRASLKA
ncbi:MAG: DUF190 domain-containing protein [candidate division KSB1 bacterium]|nr:DUF190 domain-containing protein [candidate division KSB1 bacterium]MDQ7063459.1 DUF190 domain-containing protein [candidate division KSB1 bacterium]